MQRGLGNQKRTQNTNIKYYVINKNIIIIKNLEIVLQN